MDWLVRFRAWQAPDSIASAGRFRIGHIPCLDGLRALAVSLVLLVHFPYVQGSVWSKALWGIGQATRAGYIGVDLFFVLSGFLITRILLQEKVDCGAIGFKSFFIKRALRILPIYYLSVFIAAVCFGYSSGSFASLATFTFNFHVPFYPDSNPLEHTWSLSVEEQFYLFWPFLIASMPDRWGIFITRYAVPGLSLAYALILASALESELAARLIYMSGPARMMSLSLGASLAFMEREGRIARDLNSFLLLIFGMALLAADNVGRGVGLIPAGGVYWCIALPGYALLSASTVSLLIFSSSGIVGSIRSALTLQPVRYLGRISYGLYLYHYLVLWLLDVPQYKVAGTGTSFGRLFAALAISLFVAGASYRYLERPLLSLQGRFRRQRRISFAVGTP